MRSYELSLRFTSNPNDDYKYLVRVYRQPFHRYLISRIYHWYDMHIHKVPGIKTFERWHAKKFSKDWNYVYFCDRRDVKCSFLSRQDKVILAEFEIDEATYVKMGGMAVSIEA